MEETENRINEAFARLDNYCKAQQYKGWDLFDGLNSRFFNLTPFSKSRFFRLAWIQAFKRSPINLRALTGVPKDYNPKGLALFASGLLSLGRIDEASELLTRLLSMVSPGQGTSCWGYNFPWEARAFYVPAGKPNMITTVFVAASLIQGYKQTGTERWLHAARSACDFILRELILQEDKETICFGYIPGESARVHNANLLGAMLLGKIYQITGEELLREKSAKSVNYSMKALDENGFWPYGERSHHHFIDNFHTGFNLVAMLDWMDATGDSAWESKVRLAMDAFAGTFWLPDGCPKYYHNRLYPIDIHCSAQGIVTFLKFSRFKPSYLEDVGKVAVWAIDNMQERSGYFYYQKTKYFTNRIPYIRWAQAWMFYALALFSAKNGSDGNGT